MKIEFEGFNNKPLVLRIEEPGKIYVEKQDGEKIALIHIDTTLIDIIPVNEESVYVSLESDYLGTNRKPRPRK